MIDLTPSSTGGAGRSAPSWLGRVALAVLAVALVGGGVVLARDDGSGGGGDLDPLAIGGFGGSDEMGAAAADMAYPWGGYQYQLAVDLPDLGTEAPAYQLVRPDLDVDHWSQVAAAFGVGAPATAAPDGSFVADDGSLRLDAYPVPGAWSVNVGESYDDAMIDPASSGSGSSGSSGVATDAAPGDAADAAAREDVMVEVIDEETGTTHTVLASPEGDIADETTQTVLAEPDPVPAEGLPSQAEAESTAGALLDASGVLSGAEWDVEVIEGGISSFAVACASSEDGGISEDCAYDPPVTQIESWSVVFHRVVDGVVTTGLEWTVDIGAGDRAPYVYGTVAELEPLGDYPLRTTQAAYDELVSQSGDLVGDDVGVPEPLPATDVPVAPPDTVVVDDGDPPITGVQPEPVRLRPEECASGIEPGYCVSGWCLDNAGDPMCEQPCTADSLECGVPGLPTTDVCNGDPTSSCTQVDPDAPQLCDLTNPPSCPGDPLPGECVPGPAVDCALVDPVPETTIPVCDDTVEVPIGEDGVAVSGACIAPDVVCEDTGDVDCSLVDPAPVTEPLPAPIPEPEPTVITITGVERTATVTWGVADGVEVQYLVPAYRFSGTFPDGSPWSTDLVAVSDELVVPPGEVEPPVTVTTALPPSTSPPEPPTCSDETPDACAGSLPTTSVVVTCDDTGVVPEEGGEQDDPANRCIPGTTVAGEPVTTVPVTTVVDDVRAGTTGSIE